MTGREGAYVFQGVTPGSYILSTEKGEWCWKENSVHVTVDDRDVSDVKLEHSGYMMTVQSTHSLKLVIITYPLPLLPYAYIPKYHLTVASAAARMNGSCVLL